MIKFVALLLYVMSGQIVPDQSAYTTLEECKAAVAKKIEKLRDDPRLDLGIGAWCIEMRVQEASK